MTEELFPDEDVIINTPREKKLLKLGQILVSVPVGILSASSLYYGISQNNLGLDVLGAFAGLVATSPFIFTRVINNRKTDHNSTLLDNRPLK